MSLLELLIVCAILVVVLALSLPFAVQSLSKHELAATEDSIAGELLKARVKAQESGRPVEVLVEGAPPRLIVRWFDAAAGADDAVPAGRRSREFVAPVRDTWWEESRLDPTVRITAIGMPSDETDADEADATFDDDGSGDGGAGGGTRVAVYMPDGSILFAATLLLMHQSGLHSRVSVDPWTGQPAIVRASGSSAPEPAADDDVPLERPEFDRDASEER
jgi:type II secretory pathway pseudopilin PulG